MHADLAVSLSITGIKKQTTLIFQSDFIFTFQNHFASSAKFVIFLFAPFLLLIYEGTGWPDTTGDSAHSEN